MFKPIKILIALMIENSIAFLKIQHDKANTFEIQKPDSISFDHFLRM